MITHEAGLKKRKRGQEEEQQQDQDEDQEQCSHVYVVRPLSAPMFCGNLCICPELRTISGKVYTFGRSKSSCDIIFEDCRVSRQHCQLYCHSPAPALPHRNKLFLIDGTILDNCFTLFQNGVEELLRHSICNEISIVKYVKPSANGLYVNGRLMKAGYCRALSVGDEVSLVSHTSFDPAFGPPPGFVVESINTSMPPVALTNTKYDPNYTCFHQGDKHVQRLISRASSLLRNCREVLKGKDAPFNHQKRRGDRHYCSLCSPQNTQGCATQKTLVEQNNVAILCHSNIQSLKKLPDSSSTSILNMNAGNVNDNGYENNIATVFHDKPHVNCNNKFDANFKVSGGIETVEDSVLSQTQTCNQVISKNACMHAPPTDDCYDSEPSYANKDVSENNHQYILSESRQVRLDRDFLRPQKNNAPIIGNEVDLKNIFSSQQTVNESHLTPSRNRHEKNYSILSFPQFEIQEPSVIYQPCKSEDLGNTGRQENVNAGFVRKYALGNDDHRGTGFPLDISLKNPFIDSGKIYTEKGEENFDKYVAYNICKKVTPENGQQKLSISNRDRFETEGKPSCSNAIRQNAFNYTKAQEEISAWNNVNRLLPKAVPCPSNEEREECHENVNIILSDEMYTEKQAFLRERNIEHKFHPSHDELGRLTVEETNAKDIDELLKEIHTEFPEDKLNSGDGEIIEEADDLDWEEDELLKASSINDPVLLSGKTFCLNHLESMEPNSGKHPETISLCDLLFPVENLVGIFCTTFTSDILWFLSYCRVPSHVPVTIVCHNTKRCWSRCDDQRWSRPYADWPNLTVVYPPFPDTIAFAKGPRQGVGCHHSKMLLLYRKESIRIVITSANLGPRQWLHVTNTVWWQDFPRRTTPDFLSLFKSSSFPESKSMVDGDFAVHLAGFLATLISCIPTEAHWVEELSHYDFRKASAYLIPSVPGMHKCPRSHPQLPVKFQPVSPKSSNCTSASAKYLGIVPTSVVGLSCRFHAAADLKGERLKALATLLRSSRVNMDDMMPVLLRRTVNVSADPNAISVIVCDINGSSEDFFAKEEFLTTHGPRKVVGTSSVHLGFLPKDVAKWITPLWDDGIFSFSAYICPHEALETASGRSNNKVYLILYVYLGQNFDRISTMPMCNQHIVFTCNLLGSLQRPYGLWRLQEVLSYYKWPNSVETDFIYGSSSIGMSLDARFLAAFSAAAGRKSTPSTASDDTDPEWGCWNAQHESEDPSIGIVFPTIQRVKSGKDGTLPYSHLLSFAESTWERLKSAKILHDAVPYPRERVGCPMHTKVARRRFQYYSSTPSFGWIYCGSHNFSPAAWGRPMFKPTDSKGATSAGSVLGSTLHICNYEIGLLFIVPPPEDPNSTNDYGDLDNFTLPFVVPAPKYIGSDRPATSKAICEARIEMLNLQKMDETRAVKCFELDIEEAPVDEDVPIEDAHGEGLGNGGQEEEEEEKLYAETLWSQFDSCHS